jgi:hypothetical protein
MESGPPTATLRTKAQVEIQEQKQNLGDENRGQKPRLGGRNETRGAQTKSGGSYTETHETMGTGPGELPGYLSSKSRSAQSEKQNMILMRDALTGPETADPATTSALRETEREKHFLTGAEMLHGRTKSKDQNRA